MAGRAQGASCAAETPAAPGPAAEDGASCVQGPALPGADRRPRSEFSAALGSEPLISLQERRRTCSDS